MIGHVVTLVGLFSLAAAWELSMEEVQTPCGPIRGLIDNSTGTPIQAFYGIPYAAPPIRALRFLKPIHAYRWERTLLATARRPACVQARSSYPWAEQLDLQDEDCLHVNVFAPISDEGGKPKAVLFYVFGGGFAVGSNNVANGLYDGDVLASYRDVVVVTVNYRVGVLGFATSDTEDAPGNLGLHDIASALKWVRRNIGAFGGDRERVTLVGQGSGAVAASLLVTSPMAKGLFSNAILMSGSLVQIPSKQKEKNIELTQKFAEAVGCANNATSVTSDPEAVFDCLRETDPHMLSSAVQVDSFNPRSPDSFSPHYGDELLPGDSTLDVFRVEAASFDSGVKVLVGNDYSEGSLMLAAAYPELFDPYAASSPQISKKMAGELLRGVFKDFDGSDALVSFYMDTLKEDDYTRILRDAHFAVGDYQSVCPSVYLAESLARRSDVYYYLNSYRVQRRPDYAPWIGIAFFTEVQLMFGQPLRPNLLQAYSERDRSMSLTLMHVFTHFAKHGEPPSEFEWPKYSSSVHDFIFPYFSVRYLLTEGPHLLNCNFLREYFRCQLLKNNPDLDPKSIGSTSGCSGLPQSSPEAMAAINNKTYIGTPIYFREATAMKLNLQKNLVD